MADFGNIGERIMGVVGDFIALVVILALATQLSPTAIQYITGLGDQMVNSTSTLVQVLGNIFKDYGPVVWYGSLTGGAFGAIYDMIRRFWKRE